MLDVVLDDIPFNALNGLSTFFIIFYVTIHFGLKADEFNYGSTSSFVFEFSDDFLIACIIIW